MLPPWKVPSFTSFQVFRCLVLGDFSLWGIFQVSSPAKYKTFQVRCMKNHKLGKLQVLVKYLANVEKFNLNLQSDPLIIKLFIGRRPILKERAFEQCIAT